MEDGGVSGRQRSKWKTEELVEDGEVSGRRGSKWKTEE